MKTNRLMSRSAGGQFSGLSERASAIKLKYEAKLDARAESQLARATERMQANAVYSLKGAAYVLTQYAKASIVTSKGGKWGASRPGEPPHTRGIPQKSLRAAIWYEVDKEKQSAVIGPRGKFVGTVGALHEFGGVRRGKRGSQRFPKRPFMAPALERAKPQIPQQFRQALVGPGT